MGERCSNGIVVLNVDLLAASAGFFVSSTLATRLLLQGAGRTASLLPAKKPAQTPHQFTFIGVRRSRHCGRRTRARTGKHRVGRMSLARLGNEDALRALRSCTRDTQRLWQRRAVEEQAAITAFLHQHMQLAPSRGAAMVLAMGLVLHGRHGAVHGHGGPLVVHRHRLGNQRPDEHHQHCEEADPAGAGLSRRPGRRAPGAQVDHRLNAHARRHRPAPAPG